MRRYPTPPPMSPATSSAHNFYSGFAPTRHPNDSPPLSYNQPPPPPPPPQTGPISRPGSAAPSSHHPSYYISPSGYANAQYYDDRQSGLGPGGWSYTTGAGGSTSGGASYGGVHSPPPLRTTFNNMNLGPSPANMSEEAYRKYVQEQHQKNSSPPPPPKLRSNNYVPQSAGLPYRTTSPHQNSLYYPPQSAGLPRMTPPPTTNNKVYSNNNNNNASGQEIQRPPSQSASRMPGAFPDENTAKSDLPFRNPIIGVKAAAAAKAKEQAPLEQPASDPYWGYLFDHDSSPPVAKELLSQLLKGIADYIIEDFEPKNSIVITPPKMMAFYTKFKTPTESLEWDNFFFGRPVKALSEIYQVLNCHHHLVPPKDSANSAPTVPGLTPRGFERWMTVQILSNPDREAKRLIAVLKQCPIQKHDEKDPLLRRFPKTLTREAFPKYADREMSNLWELFTPDGDANSQPLRTPTAPSRPPQVDREREAMEKEREREALIAKEHEREVLEREREREAFERQRLRDQEIELEREELEREQLDELDRLDHRGLGRSNTAKQQDYDDRGLKRTKSKSASARTYDTGDTYETMPPPPLPSNGIERERKPYSRATPSRREDVSLHDSDDEPYLMPTPPVQTRPRANTRNTEPEMGGDTYGSRKIPTRSPVPPSPRHDSATIPAKYSDLDREEEDLYQMMAAKQAEISAIEERLSRQRGLPTPLLTTSFPPNIHNLNNNNNRISTATLDYDEEEAHERARRAEEDWEREERERKKWAEAGRQRYEKDYGHDGSNRHSGLSTEEYTVGTPISQYSWRDSYGGAPAGPGGKRATTGGGRISGGGEWEEFKYDEVSPVRPRNGGERVYSSGSGGGGGGGAW